MILSFSLPGSGHRWGYLSPNVREEHEPDCTTNSSDLEPNFPEETRWMERTCPLWQPSSSRPCHTFQIFQIFVFGTKSGFEKCFKIFFYKKNTNKFRRKITWINWKVDMCLVKNPTRKSGSPRHTFLTFNIILK